MNNKTLSKDQSPVFTTWERYQLSYIGRQMGKILSNEEKVLIVNEMGWRNDRGTV